MDEKNANRYTDQLIYYDGFWAEKHDGKTGTGAWGVEVVVQKSGEKYLVSEIVPASGTPGNSVIPENGFVLSGHGAGAAAIAGFALGDELTFTDTADFVVKNLTRGMELLLNTSNADPADCANVWKPSSGTQVPGVPWRNRIVCDWSQADNAYKVLSKLATGGDALPTDIPENGFVLDMHGACYSTDAASFYGMAGVGDLVYFEDKTVAVDPANITVASGAVSIDVDGINPTADKEIGNKSLIYTNQSGTLKTLARSEADYFEYTAVKAEGGYRITGKSGDTRTAIPAYDGFVLSIPASVGHYDAFSEGDVLTVTGEMPQLKMYIGNVTKDRRVIADAANLDRGADQLVVYDDRTFTASAQAGMPEPVPGFTGTNEWGAEVKVEKQGGKFVVTQVTAMGAGGNMEIPEGGFVLSGNGTGATRLAGFAVGDEVTAYDRTLETNAALTGITVNGAPLEDFRPDVKEYAVTVAADASAPLIAATAATRAGRAPRIEIAQITAATGTVVITVTAPDGVTEGQYRLVFDTQKSENRDLASIAVNGVALEGFDAGTTSYTVYVEKGGAVPTVTAEAADAKAKVEVQPAQNLSGETKIVVTAENEAYKKTYKLSFVEVDVTLSGITVGDQPLSGFAAGTASYEYELAAGTAEAPKVAATATDAESTVTVTQADSPTGKAVVKVTKNGVTKTYEIQFSLLQPAAGCGCGIVSGFTGWGGMALVAGIAVVGILLLSLTLKRRSRV